MSIIDPSGLPRLALIAGPTASGKSARALELAESVGGTIINADASQVYRDLRVLSARPSAEEEARVPHRLFGHRDGALACSAADWAEEARVEIARAHEAGRLPILVGGTGLYVRTLLDGIAPVPDIDPAVRAIVRAMPVADAYRALQDEDPPLADRLHPNDTTRVQRALEVVRATGRSLEDWRRATRGGIRASVSLLMETIDLPVAELYARCDARVDRMVEDGALDEVASLIARRLDPDLPVMRAIGVAQFGRYIAGKSTLEHAVAGVRQATRNYAKRQRTWLRHQH
ncbi:tRNA (adenosine(37)-N6)-dimethylallyltransferase MiaA [Sphingomonas sp. MMS24-J13]|uniref:tRNA (adenosine(37)-N6)-dimethylallyltransferase MiaA n=1 Tax=Sphingomonas sp. MMS24-J13 TaxID=3238686 RepID=UPI00384B31FA